MPIIKESPVRASAIATRSATTRAAIVAAARGLFVEQGYFGTSIDQILAAAAVGTKGALYHHFTDKRALFQAVFEELEQELMAAAAATSGRGSALDRLRAGLLMFLEMARSPEVHRILLIDGPVVLGWQQWRELDGQYGLGAIHAALDRAVEEGSLEPQPTAVMAQLLLAVVDDAAMYIANATDPDQASVDAINAFTRLFDGLSRPAPSANPRTRRGR